MYSEAQKRAIYNWRKKNKEKWNEYQNELNKKSYYENIEERKKKQKEYYEKNREARIVYQKVYNLKKKEEKENGEQL